MKKVKNILITVVVVVVLVFTAIGVNSVFRSFYKESADSTNAMITARLQDASELTTKKMFYSGLLRYSDEGYLLINKGDFGMVYYATVRAGIDFSKVEVDVSDSKVIIRMPKAEIQSVDVDSDNVEFYDEKFALMNFDEKLDVTNAITQAQASVEASEEMMVLLEEADESAKVIVTKLLEDEIGDRELVIEEVV